jgi:hypothetical protein
MVRMERSLRVSESPVRVTEIARTASATAISSRFGSKMMFSPTEITRRVTGGRTGWDCAVGVCFASLLVMRG